MVVSNTRYHASEEKRNSYRVRKIYTVWRSHHSKL